MREAIEENRSLISRFTFCPDCRADQLSPKEGCANLLSFSASQLNFIATQLNFIANHLNVIASFVNLDATVGFHLLAFLWLVVHVFQCRSRPRNNRSCQHQAACRSCVGNCCQGIQFCLQKPSNYLAEAVHRFCRCLTVATILDSSCLVISVHVMFISLFLDLMSTVFICK